MQPEQRLRGAPRLTHIKVSEWLVCHDPQGQREKLERRWEMS